MAGQQRVKDARERAFVPAIPIIGTCALPPPYPPPLAGEGRVGAGTSPAMTHWLPRVVAPAATPAHKWLVMQNNPSRLRFADHDDVQFARAVSAENEGLLDIGGT